MEKHPSFLLPCPICNGVEGCDHTVLERARAASSKLDTATGPGPQTVASEKAARAAVDNQLGHLTINPGMTGQASNNPGMTQLLVEIGVLKRENDRLRRQLERRDQGLLSQASIDESEADKPSQRWEHCTYGSADCCWPRCFCPEGKVEELRAEIDRHNALLGAAPDLLEACSDTLKKLEKVAWLTELPFQVAKLRDAIAKASPQKTPSGPT